MNAFVSLLTPLQPGAVAVLAISGADGLLLLEQLAEVDLSAMKQGSMRRLNIKGDDVLLSAQQGHYLLMPHGAPVLVRQIMAALLSLGAKLAKPSEALFSEADDELESQLLYSLAHAQSPALLDVMGDALAKLRYAQQADIKPDAAYRHLIVPPRVVVAGVPNSGKSSLLNRIASREAALASPHAGTTRDWVETQVVLPWHSGWCVSWIDTPGVRDNTDELEQVSIERARHLHQEADCLVGLVAPDGDKPALPRQPDLWVYSKADLCVEKQSARLYVSAETGEGLESHGALVSALATYFGLDRLDPNTSVWDFTK